MTEAINAHARRHDAYHDWFEYDGGGFVRRMIEDPQQINFVAVDFGQMDSEQVRTHALTTTPETLQWDCYASVDHLHIDGISAGLIFFDIHLMYQHLTTAAGPDRATAPAAVMSYRDYAVRQHEKLSGLTLTSPETRDWLEFAQDTTGDWPSFPLPLGDTAGGNDGAFVTVELLDAAGTDAFDAVCRTAGARFVLACAARLDPVG